MGADSVSGVSRDWRTILPRVALLGYVALIIFLSSRPHLDSPIQFPLWDKVAHLIEYGLLGWLGTQVLASFEPGRRRWRPLTGMGFVLAAGLLIGLIDEGVQSRVQGRDASLADLASDIIGVWLGWGLARMGSRRGNSARAGEA